MESLPNGVFIKYNENCLKLVRKLFGLDKPGAMENAINILEEWVKMQTHFKKTDFERRYLETAIIVSKGSLEKAKSRLDRGCTLRTLMPHIFGSIHDIRHLYQNELKGIVYAILPKMTKNNERVTVVQIKKIENNDTILNVTRATTFTAEYLRRYDYAETNVIVFDFTETDLVENIKVLTTSVNAVQNLTTYMLDCCGFRLKMAYVISSSKFIEAIVALYKQLVSSKLHDRIRVLKAKEDLKDIFDIDMLPKEYGGNEKSLQELKDQWMDVVSSEEYIQYMKEINSACTDEAKRQSAKFNEEYLGMPGSFRKLDVD